MQQRDGYPGDQLRDLVGFLVSDDAIGAWVAELDGRVVGHVALHNSSLPVVMDVARAATGVTDDESLAVVARLLVDPDVRRLGAGRALLQAASSAAWALGRHPILDVVTRYDAANSLYRACGWTKAGEVDMVFPDFTLHSAVYVAPPLS